LADREDRSRLNSALVNDMSAAGLSPRTVRWTHTVLKMTLDHASDAGHLIAKKPGSRTKFPPMRDTTHTYLTAAEVAVLARVCGDQGDVVSILAYTGLRFGELTGLNVEDVDLDARDPGAPLDNSGRGEAGGRQPEIEGGASIGSDPPNGWFRCSRHESTAVPGAAAVTSAKGSRLGLENWKRSVRWRMVIAEIGREKLRVHDLRHTYASLSRRAGADLRLLQKAMGHASITVTAHTYADLFDDELDDIAAALDSLGDFQNGGK
jgi:integrase